MWSKQKNKRILPNLVIATVLLLVILMTGASLTKLQDQAVNIKDDLANLEYINACTQRLVKLAALGHDTNTLLTFLEGENQRLLNVESLGTLSSLGIETLDEYIADLLDSWEQVYSAIMSEDLEDDVLFLASDNHFFKMSNLTTQLNILETSIDKDIQRIESIMIIIFIFTCIFFFYWFIDTRIEVQKNKEMTEIAVIDSATGLYNRSKCQEIFETDYKKNKPIGIIVFDLNDLKVVNDSKGHAMGDAMIVTFAQVLQRVGDECSKKPFLGRYGGDEFVVYFEALEDPALVEQFVHSMENLTQETNKTLSDFRLSYAVGYAMEKAGENISTKDLFTQADHAMYVTKQKMKHKEVQIQTTETPEPVAPTNVTANTTLAIERRAEESRLQNRRFAFGLSALAALLICLYVHFIYQDLDYIGGNVLYLSTDDLEATTVDDILVPSPWKNASLSTMLLYRSLFQADATLMEISPDLAKSHKISQDGMTYTITMNNNLYWSDGVELTGEDVVFSIESFLLCENVNVYLSTALQTIHGTEAWRNGESDSLAGLTWEGNVITIELDYPYSGFLQALAQFVPLPKHILSDLDPRTFISNIAYYHQPVCSGMYMVEVNEDYTLVKNPYYNGAESDIDTIVFLSDYSPLDLDFYCTNAISEMVNYRSIRGFEEYPVDLYFYRYFIFNMEGIPGQAENPLEDERVRIAIFHALDRPSLLDSIYFNTGNLITSGLIESDWQDFYYEYNPEKARALLEEAEYDFDRPFTLMYYYNDSTSEMFMEEVKKYLEAVGLTVKVMRSTSNYSLYDTRPYDMMLKGLSSFNYEGWYNEFSSSTVTLHKVFGTDAFDDLLKVLNTTTDERIYAQTLEDLKELEQKMLYKLPLFTLKQGAYVNSNRLSVPSNMDFGNSLFRYDLRFDEWSILKE